MLEAQHETQIDHHLSNLAINYRPSGFIADQIFPVVPVFQQRGSYTIYNQGDLFRKENTRRSRGTEANKVQSSTSSNSYYAENFALKTEITVEESLHTDPSFLIGYEENKVKRLQDSLYLDWEMRLANRIQSTHATAERHTIETKWDEEESDPLEDLWQVADQVELSTGYRPNRVLFPGLLWQAFRRHSQVILRAGGSEPSKAGVLPSREHLESLLEMKVMVGNAWYNIEKEGLGQNLGQVWGENILVFYAPEVSGVDTPSYGYSLRWALPGLPNMQVERHAFDSRRHATEIEIGYYQDEVIMAKSLGCLLNKVMSESGE